MQKGANRSGEGGGGPAIICAPPGSELRLQYVHRREREKNSSVAMVEVSVSGKHNG